MVSVLQTVLQRADRQRIPMNLPEAQEIATLEVVRAEVRGEEDAARREQLQDAQVYLYLYVNWLLSFFTHVCTCTV